MGAFFLLYLVVAIENIASFLSVFSLMGWLLAGALVFTVFVVIFAADFDYDRDETFPVKFGRIKKTFKRLCILAVVLIFTGATGKLLPSQQDMLIIAGGTATYHVLTSDAAKEVGSKVYEKLLDKLEALEYDHPILDKKEEPTDTKQSGNVSI